MHPANTADFEYVGFWARIGACLLDSILYAVIAAPLLWALYGTDYLFNDALFAGPADLLITQVLPGVLIILFWLWKSATPGKMAVRARVVDAATGAPLTGWQGLGRYLGYVVSALPFGLGFLWVAFDPRKRGWHDLLAGTVVIRPRRGHMEAVTFGAPRPLPPALPQPAIDLAPYRSPGAVQQRRSPALAIILGLLALALAWTLAYELGRYEPQPRGLDSVLQPPDSDDDVPGSLRV